MPHGRRYHGYRILGLLLVAAALWLETAGASAANTEHAASRHRVIPAAPAAADISPLNGGWKRLSVNAPQPVADAALAWDGADRVLFLFGGRASETTSDAFWAYRPSRTKAGAAGWLHPSVSGDRPDARAGATAVWDDRDGVLLVLDGARNGRETDSLYAYKPGRGVVGGRGGAVAGRWADVGAPGGPLRRAFHSVVWDSADGVMILFGGETNGVPLGDTWTYKPARGGLTPGTWTRLSVAGVAGVAGASGPAARQRAMAAWDAADGVMLLSGGTGYNGLFSDLWSFRPAKGRSRAAWTRLSATAPLGPRAGGAALWDSAGKRFLVFGGQIATPTPAPPAPPAPPALVVRQKGTSTPVSIATGAPLPSATSAPPSATAVPSATPSSTSTSTNTATNTPTQPANTATAVPSATPSPLPPTATATGTATGTAMATATLTGATTAIASSAMTTGAAALPGAASARAGLYSVSAGAGRGRGRAAYVTAGGVSYGDDLWSYSAGRRGLAAGSWHLLRQSGGPLARATGAVYDGADRSLLLFGGQSVSALGDVWSYPLVARDTSRWTLLDGGQPQARAGQAGAWDSRDGVLFIFGGYNSARLNDLWAYKPARGATGRWTLIPLVGPAARTEASLVWDSADNALLLFGGGDVGGSLNDVWAYRPAGDGTAPGRWTAVSVTGGAPSGRHLHSAVWDSANRQMLVFAGETGPTVLRDLWAFHLDNLAGARGHWSAPVSAAVPSARFAQAAVWDPSGSRMLLFGGVNGAGGFLDDLWAYYPGRGNAAGRWASLGTPGTPDARATTAAIWDGADNALVIFGGTGPGSIRNDTYAYRGSWSAPAYPGAPERRNGSTAVYDTVNNALLLYGGAGARGALNDLWQLGGYRPASRATSGGKSGK